MLLLQALVQNDSNVMISGSEANDKTDLVKNLVKYCTIVVGTLPVLCIYPFVQKYFVHGVTLDEVKG